MYRLKALRGLLAALVQEIKRLPKHKEIFMNPKAAKALAGLIAALHLKITRLEKRVAKLEKRK